jgi:two-component system OmpR family response regulator
MEADKAARRRWRILAIEDDEPTRMLFALALEDEGFSVATARNGLEALRLLETEAFDLILLDLHMPGLDGQDFLRVYHQRSGPAAPVLVVSAQPHLEESIGPGPRPDGFLAKPFDIDQLRAKVLQLVGGANGER